MGWLRWLSVAVRLTHCLAGQFGWVAWRSGWHHMAELAWLGKLAGWAGVAGCVLDLLGWLAIWASSLAGLLGCWDEWLMS